MEKVTIRLAKSLIGRGKEQPDNAATQGKIAKIAHLVVVTKG